MRRHTQHDHHPGGSGFTLIELLVVVAIISLLVSILLPSLSRAKELAKRAVCASTLHSVGLGVQMYSADSDEFPPPQYGNYSYQWAGSETYFDDQYAGDQHSFITLPYRYRQELTVPWWMAMKSYVGESEDAVACPARTWEDDSWYGRNSYHWWGWTRLNVERRGWWAGRPRDQWNVANITSNDAKLTWADDLLMSDVACEFYTGATMATHVGQEDFAAGANQLYVGGNVSWMDFNDLNSSTAAFSTIYADFPD